MTYKTPKTLRAAPGAGVRVVSAYVLVVTRNDAVERRWERPGKHAPYFRNGVATTLSKVLEVYNTREALSLAKQQKADRVQYLKSL